MIYRVVLVGNGEYRKTFHRSLTKDTAFINYHKIKDSNKVNFPKRYVNAGKITPVRYQICVTKPTELSDKFRVLRDDLGRTYTEKPLGDWTILASENYDIEETFWVYGMNSKIKRPNITEIIKRLVKGAHKRNYIKQIIVVHNKLVIYNEDEFHMVICKCKKDAQRLHHTLSGIVHKQRIKSLIFMGTASPASISRMYEVIQEHTHWPIEKIRRRTTRP